MTPLETCDAIEAFLRLHLGSMRLPAPEGGESEIHFYQMALPQPGTAVMDPRPESEDGEERDRDYNPDDEPLEDGGYSRNEARRIFPAVIIRPGKLTGGDYGTQEDELTVVITVGVFEESNDCAEGFKWVVTILERCRQLFRKYRLLEERYEIATPVTWELYDEAIRPFWFGEMVSEWKLPIPWEEIELDDDYRGGNYPTGNGPYPNDPNQ